MNRIVPICFAISTDLSNGNPKTPDTKTRSQDGVLLQDLAHPIANAPPPPLPGTFPLALAYFTPSSLIMHIGSPLGKGACHHIPPFPPRFPGCDAENKPTGSVGKTRLVPQPRAENVKHAVIFVIRLRSPLATLGGVLLHQGWEDPQVPVLGGAALARSSVCDPCA
jgi:hypothetical protein